jgi:hypothetical protein
MFLFSWSGGKECIDDGGWKHLDVVMGLVALVG